MSGGYVTWPQGEPERAQHTNSYALARFRKFVLTFLLNRRMRLLRLAHSAEPCNPIVEARACERIMNRRTA